MSWRIPVAIASLGLLLAACGNQGAKQYQGDSSEAVMLYGSCAFCHVAIADNMIATGGHGNPDFRCQFCHPEDLLAGQVGPGHRNVPQCRSCHSGQMTHPPAEAAGGGDQECVVCHTPHGSPNIYLVKPILSVPGGQLRDVVFDNEMGRADGSFASASNPGSGPCEICHTTTRHYRSDGSGEPHFTSTCTACHRHPNGFLIGGGGPTRTSAPATPTRTPATPGVTPTSAPVTRTPSAGTSTPTSATPVTPQATATATPPFGVCAVCHPDKAESLLEFGGHGDANFVCESCHAQSLGEPGPGHRSIPLCTDCHSEPMTHEPAEAAVGGRQECVVCHTPHGSPNIYLVKPLFTVPGGAMRDVVFDNEMGRADGSFASASAPGSGLCEICHTTTRHYRSDGTGEPHFTITCTGCHTHPQGFLPF